MASMATAGTPALAGRAYSPAERPAEARHRAGGWPVLAADPALVAELVEKIEQIGVIDLATAYAKGPSATTALVARRGGSAVEKA